jgi:hypothetical protein
MSDFSRLMEAAIAAGVPAGRPTNVDIPFVSGTGDVGSSLNCTMGNWTGEPTGYVGKWMSDGTVEVGTGADYVVADTDVGHSLTCVVTATNVLGEGTAPPSNAIVVPAVMVQSASRSSESHSESRRK